MSEITKPILLNETGQETNQKLDTLAAKEQLIADAINNVAQNYTDIHAAAVSAQQQATAAAASAAAADNSAGDAADSAAAAAQKLDDLEAFLSGLDPESAASVAAELGLFEQEVASDYAKKDGYYEQMGVGTADNLAGHGSVNAEYTFRTSGGDSDIGTGAAAIDTVKGNTLVWNQLIMHPSSSAWSSISAKGTISYNSEQDYLEYTVNNAESGLKGAGILGNQVEVNTNHKYYVFARLMMSKAGEVYLGGYSFSGISSRNFNLPQANTWVKLSEIFTNNASTSGGTNYYFSIQSVVSGSVEIGDKLYIQFPMLIDLTKMFGSGNEPSTVAEFEALYPLSYYAYNAGTLINNSASGIKTIGFNQWDEQWENGGIDLSTGQEQASTWQIRPANFIPCFPDTDYFFKGPSVAKPVWMCFYDANKVYLPDTYIAINTGNTFHTPTNARYMKFKIGYGSPESYRYPSYIPGDICINLSWSGYRNGEYEPYEEHTVYFDSALGASGSLATIKGRKLNAQGEIDDPTAPSAAVFTDGMKSAVNAYDEAKGNTANKVLSDNIILSNIAWQVDSNGLAYSPQMTNLKGGVVNSKANFITTAPYTPVVTPQYHSAMGNNEISISTDNRIFIHDTSCTTREQLNTKLANAVLCAELATPETYLLDNPLPSNYVVNDFGTEERLPADTSSSVMAPILYSVQYAMNATDNIRRLPINYISKESFENFCASLASAIGPYLNPPATIAVTSTYNDNTQEYDYQVTVTPTENNG